MSIIFVGNTGVGKSFVCNKLFEKCSSSTRFQSHGGTDSCTQSLQTGTINYRGKTYTIVDSPGFFDTEGSSNDGMNMCKLVKAIENCQQIYALVFVFTDRFSTPHQIWYDRIASLIHPGNVGHIILLHNKQTGQDDKMITKNAGRIEEKVGKENIEYIWFNHNPDDNQVTQLLNTLVNREPFRLSNLVVPAICYDRDEKGSPYDEVAAQNTSDEGHFVEQVRDTSHYENRLEWDRNGFKPFGWAGIRGIGQVK